MNYKQYEDKFTKYVYDHYDMENNLISLKYYHTLRVANNMLLIAEKLNLNESDKLLAYQIGLFHDLGRFHEVVRSAEFNNLKFDHGAYSNKVLYNDDLIKEFDIKEENNLLIKKSLYFHNKKDITDNLNDREMLFAMMIRDADKIDILKTVGELKKQKFNAVPSPLVHAHFMANESIDLKLLQNRSDRVLLYLGFMKGLHLDESFEVLTETKNKSIYIDNVEVDPYYKKLFNYYVENIERKKEYVR